MCEGVSVCECEGVSGCVSGRGGLSRFMQAGGEELDSAKTGLWGAGGKVKRAHLFIQQKAPGTQQERSRPKAPVPWSAHTREGCRQ